MLVLFPVACNLNWATCKHWVPCVLELIVLFIYLCIYFILTLHVEHSKVSNFHSALFFSDKLQTAEWINWANSSPGTWHIWHAVQKVVTFGTGSLPQAGVGNWGQWVIHCVLVMNPVCETKHTCYLIFIYTLLAVIHCCLLYHKLHLTFYMGWVSS